MSADQRLKIAVFIDFDNVEIGVKTTLGLHFDVGAVLEAIKERGEIITKIAYSDWKRSGDHGRAMANHAVRLVQRVMTPGGDKNGADINLALDALEMAFTHDHINAFVIVGGDSDFITLVEKLKQYDKKVFVVGGRQFTSQVMQKNCTEFIAYENIAPDRRASVAAQPRAERGRPSQVAGSASLDQAMPLVKRALQVLTDREVTPQLGLLKSTLLQLDSSFSERDYGVTSFRDFAERLAERGFVSLKHNGRSTLVELAEGGSAAAAEATTAEASAPAVEGEQGERVAGIDAPLSAPAPPLAFTPAPSRRDMSTSNANIEEGVAMLRRVLADPPQPPRWPMYLRQMKQFIRSAEPEFDERKHGSIVDLMRACQKEGLVRLERDRQGGLRVFATSTATAAPIAPPPTGQVYQPKRVTPGWTIGQDIEDRAPEEADGADGESAAEEAAASVGPIVITPPVEDEEPHDAQTNFFGPEGVVEKAIPGAPRRQRRGVRKPVGVVVEDEKPKRARKAPVARKTATPRPRRKPSA
jgi:uncharacterized LabA/DUF88 family protein